MLKACKGIVHGFRDGVLWHWYHKEIELNTRLEEGAIDEAIGYNGIHADNIVSRSQPFVLENTARSVAQRRPFSVRTEDQGTITTVFVGDEIC